MACTRRLRILLTVPMVRADRMRTRSWSACDSLNDSGLGYVAASCVRAGAEVTLLSWDTDLDRDGLRLALLQYQPDVVGVKVLTPLFRAATTTLQVVRNTLPRAITVIGGPHPSTTPPAVLFTEFGHLIDYGVAGDGELAMAGLLSCIAPDPGQPSADRLRHIPGLVYINGTRPTANPPCYPNLGDEEYILDWSLQPPARFSTAPNPALRGAYALICDSRGCPARCGHCTAGAISGGGLPRRRSAAGICAELEELFSRYSLRAFDFTGNNFLSDVDAVSTICEWLAHRGSGVTWGCTGAAHIASLDDDHLLRLMHRAGCRSIHFGVESGSEPVAKALHKPFSLAQCDHIVRRVRNAGIAARGYFMFGFPNEELRDMRQTIRYAFQTPFSTWAFAICLPLPGTSSHLALLRQLNVDRIDWSKYGFQNPQLLPSKATPRQVRVILRIARVLAKTPISRSLARYAM